MTAEIQPTVIPAKPNTEDALRVIDDIQHKFELYQGHRGRTSRTPQADPDGDASTWVGTSACQVSGCANKCHRQANQEQGQPNSGQPQKT